MKFILIIFSIFLLNTAFANQNDNAEVEVIDLYATKTLDQMVLDDLNNEEEIAEEIEEITTSSNENNENENNELEVKQIEISNNDFFLKMK